MRVLVVHQPVEAHAAEEERDVLTQAAAVTESLQRLGWQVETVPAGRRPEDLDQLLRDRQPELVVNLVESFFGIDFFQFLAACVLEDLEIPFTGCGGQALFLTCDKIATKTRLRTAGLPTPVWIAPSHKGTKQAEDLTARTFEHAAQVWRELGGRDEIAPQSQGPQLAATLAQWRAELPTATDLPPAPPVDLPQDILPRRFLLKSAWSHASAGLVESLRVVQTTEDIASLLDELAEHARRTRQPWFAEEYIEGREFNVALIATAHGPVVFPLAEIDFSAFPPEKLRIVGYRAKWDAASFEYHATPRRFTFSPQDAGLLRRLRELAVRCWDLFQLRGCARVDFRVDQAGNPWILEINANPCISPDAGFAAAAAQAGWSYDDIVAALVEDALRTGP